MASFWYKRVRIALIPSALKRTRYLVEHNIFKSVGEKFFFQPRFIPQDPKFIIFHNNVSIASNVTFITHDVIQKVFNNIDLKKQCKKHYVCIEIMDNVFIGSNTTILSNIRIGPNVIVGAGSVITKDVPPNSIVAGVPAEIIGKFDELYNKRVKETKGNPYIYNELERSEYCWKMFYERYPNLREESKNGAKN